MMAVQPYFGFESSLTFRTGLRGRWAVRFVLCEERRYIDLSISDILLVRIIAHESHSLDRKLVVQEICDRLGIRGFRNVKQIDYRRIGPTLPQQSAYCLNP